MDAIAELMDVMRDLCRFATVFRMAGPDSWAETLIEQCAELLAHRARLLSGSREGTRASHPTSETNAVTDGGGVAGFESKNYGWTSFSAGGVRALWWSNIFPDDRRLILVESAIDALSFHQVHAAPRVRYASTAGTLSEHQRRILADALKTLPPGMTVGLAFDADPAGNKLAEQLRALGAAEASRDRPPIGKDWNEYLQHLEREHVSARTPSRGHSRSR